MTVIATLLVTRAVEPGIVNVTLNVSGPVAAPVTVSVAGTAPVVVPPRGAGLMLLPAGAAVNAAPILAYVPKAHDLVCSEAVTLTEPYNGIVVADGVSAT